MAPTSSDRSTSRGRSTPSSSFPVLPAYHRLHRVAFHAKRLGRVQLVATDTAWEAGAGPQVRGRAVDLLLFLANRSQVTPALSGPGLGEQP